MVERVDNYICEGDTTHSHLPNPTKRGLCLRNLSAAYGCIISLLVCHYIPFQPLIARVLVISFKLQENVPQIRRKFQRPIRSDVDVGYPLTGD